MNFILSNMTLYTDFGNDHNDRKEILWIEHTTMVMTVGWVFGVTYLERGRGYNMQNSEVTTEVIWPRLELKSSRKQHHFDVPSVCYIQFYTYQNVISIMEIVTIRIHNLITISTRNNYEPRTRENKDFDEIMTHSWRRRKIFTHQRVGICILRKWYVQNYNSVEHRRK